MQRDRLIRFCAGAVSLSAVLFFMAGPSQAVPLTADDVHPTNRLRASMQNFWHKHVPFEPVRVNGPKDWSFENRIKPPLKNGPGPDLKGGHFFDEHKKPKVKFAEKNRKDGDSCPTPVPEPSTFLLYGSGLAAMVFGSRFMLKKKGQP